MKTLITVVILMGLGLYVYADDRLSSETRQFMSYASNDRLKEAASITPEENLRRIAELKEASIRNPAGRGAYLKARAFLGDELALHELVMTFLDNDGASPGILGKILNPRIIEVVAPEFYREEPMSMGGGDVIIVPRSYRAAELAVELTANSPAFNGDVINWARTVQRLSFTEKRDLVRPWWKANEPFFREKNYKAVQPGPPPSRDPFLHEEIQIPAAEPSTPAPPVKKVEGSTPAHAQPIAKPAASSGWLWIIAIGSIGAIAFLLFNWSRRGRR